MVHLLVMPILFLMISGPVLADDRSIIDVWYEALKESNRDVFNEILDDNAVIDLKQLGVTQTKSEFLTSLDAWDEVVSQLSLSYSWEGIDATSATATVCYKFDGNAYTNLEVFVVGNGRIIRQEQERLMEGC